MRVRFRCLKLSGDSVGEVEMKKSADVCELRQKIHQALIESIKTKQNNIEGDDSLSGPASCLHMIVNGRILTDKVVGVGSAKLYMDFNIKGGELVEVSVRDRIGNQSNGSIAAVGSEKLSAVPNGDCRPSSANSDTAANNDNEYSGCISTEPDRGDHHRNRNEKSDEGEACGTEGGVDASGEDAQAGDEPICNKCASRPGRKCKECHCCVCGDSKDADQTLLCDGYHSGPGGGACPFQYHIYCLPEGHKLDKMPETGDDSEEWFCPDCAQERENREEMTVMPNKANKRSKTSASKPAATAKRHWGGGVSCAAVGVKKLNIPKDHAGKVPSIKVGQMFENRLTVAQWCVHPPPVAGIHPQNTAGSNPALSIVVSGGYEDDTDKGDELIYTGQGGRDLSGNKRTNVQSKDQELLKGNRALAAACYPFKINENGGDAGDKWKKSAPIRVVRGSKPFPKKAKEGEEPKRKSSGGRKSLKHKESHFAPTQGFRYDGIYKVVKYYTVKGESGFKVWQFLLRRDDDEPAPWTEEGKAYILRHGLEMTYYDGDGGQSGGPSAKKAKVEDAAQPNKYQVLEEWMGAIKADERNSDRWDKCIAAAENGRRAFFEEIEKEFSCPVCMERVGNNNGGCDIMNLGCGHIACAPCIERYFEFIEKGVDGDKALTCMLCKVKVDASEMQCEDALKEAMTKIFA